MNTASALMTDIMSAINFFLLLCKNAPFGVWAVVIGIVLSNCAEQGLKHWIPKLFPAAEFDGQGIALPEERSAAEKRYTTLMMHKNDRREFYITTVSFIVGFLGVWLPYQTRAGVLLAVLTGAMSSKILKGVLVVLRPVWAWWTMKWKPVGE